MVNIRKIISSMILKIFNDLGGHVDLKTAKSILIEMLFLKLINNELKMKNKYFCKRIKGLINFYISIEEISEFYNELNNFIKLNKCFSELSFEIFKLKEKIDDKLMIEIIGFINSIDKVMEVKPSLIFRILLDNIFRSNRNEVITSPSINKLVSCLLKDKNIHEIYDPTIGTGMLALNVASNHESVRVYGQDINKEMLNICKMLLILDERIEDLSNIAEGNTILNPGHVENNKLKKFDCIVGNPPFGLKDWGYNEIANNDIYNRFHRGLPSRSLADYAFISHVIESLSDEGIAVMVENTGVLFKEGAEGAIREAIINEDVIDAVIALPNNMMYGTAISVNLIIFNKDKKTDDVLFIDASKEVQFNKVLTSFTDKNIEDITVIYKNRTVIDGVSNKVNISEIAENNYNLNVQRYVEVKVEKEELDMEQIENNINDLVIKLRETQSKINEILNL